MFALSLAAIIVSTLASAPAQSVRREDVCGTAAPNLAEPRFMVPIELVQGAISLSTFAGYVGGLRVHPTFNPSPGGRFRVGGTAALLRLDGGSAAFGGGRVSIRPHGGMFLSIWTTAEYLVGSGNKRAYGPAVTAELADALDVTLRVHRNEPVNEWSFDIGVGGDLRHVIGRGYAARPPTQPPAVALTPNWFGLVEDEVALSTVFLTDPSSDASKGLREIVRDHFANLGRQPTADALLETLKQANADTIAKAVRSALRQAAQTASTNNPRIPVPPSTDEVEREQVRAITRALASNLCVQPRPG